MKRKERELLRQSVATILEKKREQNVSHALIMKEAVTEGSHLYRSLENGNDYEKELDNFMRCLLVGYEIDERETYETIGLWNHPYQEKEWTDYMPTFVILTYTHEDFTGRIWLPYASKLSYVANCSFAFKKESRSLGNSRINEVHLAPQWFQELFQKAETYIKERNERLLIPYDEMLGKALEETKHLSEKEFIASTEEKDSSALSVIHKGYIMIPLLIKHLEGTKDKRICYLLEKISDIIFHHEMHDEEEEIEAYKKAKENETEWIAFWLTWGKHYL